MLCPNKRLLLNSNVNLGKSPTEIKTAGHGERLFKKSELIRWIDQFYGGAVNS